MHTVEASGNTGLVIVFAEAEASLLPLNIMAVRSRRVFNLLLYCTLIRCLSLSPFHWDLDRWSACGRKTEAHTMSHTRMISLKNEKHFLVQPGHCSLTSPLVKRQ